MVSRLSFSKDTREDTSVGKSSGRLLDKWLEEQGFE